MQPDTLAFATVRELAAALRSRAVTSAALTELFLKRLETLGPKYNAVVTVTRDLALAEARRADAELAAGKDRGPLHGVPYGVKDLLATRGVPTTWGAAPFKDQVFDYDATVITRLREAGAVLVAKLAMVELAGGFGYNQADASFTGPGRCPWNTGYWSGGSSSGPGSAVAAGLVPFAVGSETSGSIITPAAYCGVTGLRPTYGRVSRAGAMALCWTLDKLGPMARSADCCGIVLQAVAGRDPQDESSADRPFVWKPAAPKRAAGGRLRVGVYKNATARVQPAVKANFEAALKTVAGFAEVDDAGVELPALPFGAVVGTVVSAEGASSFREFIESGRTKELQDPDDRWGGQASSLVLAVDYLQAMRVRSVMKPAMAKLFEKFDVLAAPSRGTVASPISKPFAAAYPGVGGGPPVIPAGNAVGHPAVSVPNGFGDNNLPTGIQFTGPAWSEGHLLALAAAYQQATDWHKKQPQVG